jgi:hypothetical protein
MTASAYVAMLLYNAFILALFGYAVFWLGQTGWWFLLAVVMMHAPRSKGDKS